MALWPLWPSLRKGLCARLRCRGNPRSQHVQMLARHLLGLGIISMGDAGNWIGTTHLRASVVGSRWRHVLLEGSQTDPWWCLLQHNIYRRHGMLEPASAKCLSMSLIMGTLSNGGLRCRFSESAYRVWQTHTQVCSGSPVAQTSPPSTTYAQRLSMPRSTRSNKQYRLRQ